MKYKKFPILVNEDTKGFNQAVQNFEWKVFPFVTHIKALYESLQLPTPFNDAIYMGIVSNNQDLTKAIKDKISNIAPVIGINHQDYQIVIMR